MRRTIAVAESCTGGLLGAMLTQKAGASSFYLGGVTAYHDRIKRSLLGVPAAALKKHGAVSAKTAGAMAEGVRKKFKASIGISITGIAGPAGGTKKKPVGLVYIGLSDGKRTDVRRFLFRGRREAIRRQAALSSLKWLRDRSRA